MYVFIVPHSLTHTHQIGSPTALSDPTVYKTMFEAAYHSPPHGLYVPAGAFWGGQDVQKMADRGTLKVQTLSINETCFKWRQGSISKLFQGMNCTLL